MSRPANSIPEMPETDVTEVAVIVGALVIGGFVVALFWDDLLRAVGYRRDSRTGRRKRPPKSKP